jgi:hypothetical protein
MSHSDKALIQQFFELEDQIWALAGEDKTHYPGLQDCTDSNFYLDDNEIIYGQPGTDDYYGGDIYGTAIFRGKDYTIVVIDDGCGNHRCPLLLENSKAVDRDSFE